MIDNLLRCFVVSVSKALKIYSLLFNCSIATELKIGSLVQHIPVFSSDEGLLLCHNVTDRTCLLQVYMFMS
jgi:hypothetical protein